MTVEGLQNFKSLFLVSSFSIEVVLFTTFYVDHAMGSVRQADDLGIPSFRGGKLERTSKPLCVYIIFLI